jgi:hypothetical protein
MVLEEVYANERIPEQIDFKAFGLPGFRSVLGRPLAHP